MGSDSKYNSAPGGYTDFNPRSRMGSDRERRHESASNSNFNPRSRTGSDGVSLKRCTNQANFNPRSRMGSDRYNNMKPVIITTFQSTLPHGERPSAYYHQDIHRNFNPRPPHGERPLSKPIIIPCSTFQSTPPAWGATTLKSRIRGNHTISIHAPRMGSDNLKYFCEHCQNQFQSTLPAWGATLALCRDPQKI